MNRGNRGSRVATAVAQISIARPPRMIPVLALLAVLVRGRPAARGKLVLRHGDAAALTDGTLGGKGCGCFGRARAARALGRRKGRRGRNPARWA